MNARRLLAIAAAPWRRAPIVLALVAVAGGGAARGDWLVLAGGEAIETKGPWTLQGQKIVFTSTRGVLSSIRASSVNVESSRALTTRKHEEATAVVVPTPEPKREPVLVLTNEILDQARPAPAAVVDGAEAGGAAGVAAGGEAGAASAATIAPVVVPATDSLETRIARQMPGPPAVRITSWSARPTGQDQISVFGTVENVGSLAAAAITVTVALLDPEGDQIASREAAITATALMPGTQAELEARFQGDPNFAGVDFTVTVVELEVSQPEAGDQRGEGEELEEPIDDDDEANAAPAPSRSAGSRSGSARPAGAPAVGRATGDEPHATANSVVPASRPEE